MSALHIHENNFNEEVLQSEKTVLLDFWAAWCGPCQMMSPVVEALAEEHPEIKVGKVNVDEELKLAAQYGVISIPTFVVIQDGKVLRTAVGAMPKEDLEKLAGI